MSPTASQILEQALKLNESERRELGLQLLDSAGWDEQDDSQLAASEQDFAEGRVHSNADALRQLREHVERKQAFDQQLHRNYERGLAGHVISKEESLARVKR